MTTYIDFVPSTSQAFQFQATFDGSSYNVVVTWNLFGQRYYVNVYSLDGTLIVCLPLIGSSDSIGISLVAGYFSSTLVYRASNNRFEISP